MKPNRSRSGFGSRPERVVAPTSVNGARSSGMLVAPAPLPTMMSMRKSSIARYSISSAERAMRWISSMKRTSPGVRVDSSAARSPACWIAGPLDMRSGRLALVRDDHRERRLAEPGRAGEQDVVGRAGSASAAASSSSWSCPRTLRWPTNSARFFGRSAPSKASSASSTAAPGRRCSWHGRSLRGSERGRGCGAAGATAVCRSSRSHRRTSSRSRLRRALR